MTNLHTFVGEWNVGKDIRIELIGANHAKPMDIEVRFSAAKYDKHDLETYEKIAATIKVRSHETMYLVTDYQLLSVGIMSFKVASCNHNYREAYIVASLQWLGETMFPEMTSRQRLD